MENGRLTVFSWMGMYCLASGGAPALLQTIWMWKCWGSKPGILPDTCLRKLSKVVAVVTVTVPLWYPCTMTIALRVSFDA